MGAPSPTNVDFSVGFEGVFGGIWGGAAGVKKAAFFSHIFAKNPPFLLDWGAVLWYTGSVYFYALLRAFFGDVLTHAHAPFCAKYNKF